MTEDEVAVRPVDLHLGPDGQRVEGVLVVGPGETGGQLHVPLSGGVAVAEGVGQATRGRRDAHEEELPGLELVLGRSRETIAGRVACAGIFSREHR